MKRPVMRQSAQFVMMLVLLHLANSIDAQNVIASQEVTISNESRYELFAEGDGNTILYRDQPGTVMLDAYNEKMEAVWSRELNLDKGRPTPLGGVLKNGEVTVFYTYRKNRGIFLKLHRYAENGNLSDSLTITELTGDFLRPGYLLLTDRFSQYAVMLADKDANSKVVICVEIATGRIMHQTVVSQEFGSTLVRQGGEPYIDDSGSVYFWMQRNNRRSKLDEHQVQIRKVDVSGQILSATIDMFDELVYDMRLGVDERNKSLVLAGYYANDPDEAAGTIVLRIEKDFVGSATVFKTPFEQDLIKAVEQKERNPEGIKDLATVDLMFQVDGTTVIFGEQRKKTVRTVGSRGGYFNGSFKTDYLYEDIIVASVSTTGKDDWIEVLPKKQFSQDDGAAFSSYYLATSPKAVRVIHNDEVRSGGTVSEYTISGTGDVNRHSLMNTEYRDLWLRLEAGTQANANTIVIPSERRNRLKLVRITF